MRKSALFVAVVGLSGYGVVAQDDAAAQDVYASMEARAIGPAGMSGRVSDVDVVLSNRSTVFVGTATGGVFRSRTGGLTWDPVFDAESTLSIGSVAVFQPNPEIVWVGKLAT